MLLDFKFLITKLKGLENGSGRSYRAFYVLIIQSAPIGYTQERL